MNTALVYGLAVAGAATVRASGDARHRRRRRRRRRHAGTAPAGRRPRRRAPDRSRRRSARRPRRAQRRRRPGARRARTPPRDRRGTARRAGVSSASSSSPTSGSRSGRADRGRSWRSPAPTARRRRRCSRSPCWRPPAAAPSRPATPTSRSSRRSTSTSTPSSSSARASGWPGRERFRGEAAAWLNLAPDHLNWHDSLATYAAAKGQIFANQRPSDVAIGFADDPEVMRHLAGAPGRHVTFGAADADYRVEGGMLISPHGEIAAIASMRRSLPHDVTNGLAAAALVLETGLADVSVGRRRVGVVRRSAAPHRARRRGRRVSPGSTTPRRRPRMPRRRRSAGSATSC